MLLNPKNNEKKKTGKRAAKLFLIFIIFTLFSNPPIIAKMNNESLAMGEVSESPDAQSDKPSQSDDWLVWDGRSSKVNENTYKIKLLEVTPFYEQMDTSSRHISNLSPQEVTVVQRDGNFYLIKTWLGEYWIKPKKYVDENGLTKLCLEKNYTIYHSQSLDAKSNLKVSPQVVTLIEEKDNWWKIKTWVGDKYLYKHEGEKVAYITFDDGPTKYTADLLKILSNYEAKATFFMLQPNMQKHTDIVKQIASDGHYTAFHSVTHDCSKLYYGSPYNPVWEMEKSRQTLKEITNEDHYLVRMPYGSNPYMKEPFRNALVEYHYKMWDWTIDSYDWRATSQNNILINIKKQLDKVEQSGKPVVILFHELPQTIQALPSIIEYLHEKGYKLVAYHPETHISVNFWNDARL